MAIRSKTKHRLVVLLVGIVIICSAVLIIFAWRTKQKEVKVAEMRAEGIALFEQGKYYDAMHKIGSYFHSTRNQEDIESLFCYARARKIVPAPKQKNLYDAIGPLRRILEIQPDHIEAQLLLLELYCDVHYNTEALDLADTVLGKLPDQPKAVWAKALAMHRLGKHKEALSLAEKFNGIDPLNIDGQFLTLDILYLLKHPIDELLKRVDSLVVKYPNERSLQIVKGAVCGMAGDYSTALDCYRMASNDAKVDADYITLLISSFDKLHAHSDALTLLERVAPTTKDADVRFLYAKRLLEFGRINDLVSFYADLDIDSPVVRSRELAFKALGLIQLKRTEDAQKIVDILAKRSDTDDIAAAWSMVLRMSLSTDQPVPVDIAEIYRQALARDPRNPYFHFYIGKIYDVLGEKELAFDEWQQAARFSSSWAAPRVKLAKAYAASNRLREALAMAKLAHQCQPQSESTVIPLVEIWAMNLGDKTSASEAKLLDIVRLIQKANPGEEHTLPIYVALLVRSGENNAAIEAVRGVLKEDDKPSAALLASLAITCRKYDLPLANECIVRRSQLYGQTIDIIRERAFALLKNGQNDEGLQLIESSLTKADETQKIQWRVTKAKYLELAGDPSAVSEWIALADSEVTNVSIQHAVLQSRLTWTNREFIDRTIERLRSITGDNGHLWQRYRAQWLLTDKQNQRNVSDAAKILTKLVKEVPRLPVPHLLLAECFELQGNISGAIDELLSADRIRPGLDSITLKLALLMLVQGDSNRAQVYIDRIVNSDTPNAAALRQIAAILVRQGQTAEATELLNKAGDDTEAQPDLLLADLYVRSNQMDKAEQVYKYLLNTPDAAVIEKAANFYALLGRENDAIATIALLDGDINLQPGVRETVRGSYFCQHGDVDKGIAELRRAVEIAPENNFAHRSLILHLIQSGNGTTAAAAIQSAVKLLPEDATIVFLNEHIDTVKSMLDTGLVASLVNQPNNRDIAIEALGLLQEATNDATKASSVILKLRQLADRNPRFLPIQYRVIEILMTAGKAGDAAQFAVRAMQTFPSAVLPAILATDTCAAARQWSQALSAARKWRELAGSRTLAADMFIADMMLRIGKNEEAVKEVEPLLVAAMTDPDANIKIIQRGVNTLVNAGRADIVAKSSVVTLLEKESKWRVMWMQLAAMSVQDEKTAAAWLDQVTPLIEVNSIGESVALSNAWRGLYQRFGNDQYVSKAREILTVLAQRNDATAEVYLSLAMMDDADGDISAAELGYRRALELNPNLSNALNNLAMIVINSNGDKTKAIEFAQRAVASSPREAAYRDTLALAQVKNGDYDGAIESMKYAIMLERNKLGWYIGLAEIYMQSNQANEAKKIVDLIDELVSDTAVSDDYRQRLDSLRAHIIPKK